MRKTLGLVTVAVTVLLVVPSTGSAFTASPVYADGHLYFCDQEGGRCHVLAVGREPKVVATNKLDDGCMATPAIAGKELYVRTKTHLYRIEENK